MSNHWGWLLGIAMSTTGYAYALCEYFWANSASAQISPDATLPNNSIITPQGNILNITGGSQIGNNLFHSFKEFSVPTGGTAFFNNALDISNIISRVTGNSISNIDGLIRANGTANVFLLNPNGIIFGNNASLNVGGSFVGSTANAIQFGTAGIFSATTPNAPTPLLTINPSALLFLQPSPAAITSSSTAPAGVNLAGVEVTGLRVPDGKSLLLVGGDVNIDGGSLRAYNGRIELAGLAAPGNIGLNFTGNILSLGVPDVQRANVSLTNEAEVNVRGSDAGSIAINAQNLSLAGASKVRAGIDTGNGTPASKAGDVEINATGATTLTDDSFIANVPQPTSVGKGGNININTGSLALVNGSALNTNNFGQGDGGNVNLNVGDALTFSGVGQTGSSNILSSVRSPAVGRGGNINITAGSVSLADGSQLNASTYAQGDAGNVSIQARDFVSLAGSNTTIFSNIESGGVGNGGNINITAPSLTLNDGAQLQAGLRGTDIQNNLPGGRGNGGNINIDVSGAVTLAVPNNNLGTAIFSDLENGAQGNGGNINIKSGSLSLGEGTFINASTAGDGKAGNIFVQARDAVSLNNASIFSTVNAGAVGNGGNINIQTGLFSLTDESQVTATNLGGKGLAGNILINTANDFSITRGAFVSAASSGEGNAGKVTIRSGGAVLISGRGDRTSSAVTSGILDSGVGNGGDIEIQARSFSLSDGADLFTFTSGRGNAGNISINTIDDFTVKNASVAAFTSGQGNAGKIVIRAGGNISISEKGNLISTVGLGGIGSGGNIEIQGRSFSLSDNARLFTATLGKGDAGNFQINTSGDIIIKSGGQISADTFAQGNAGNVSVNAGGTVSLDGVGSGGFSSGISTQVTAEEGFVGRGEGGNINITARNLSITNRAALTSSSSGQGNAGDININTRSVRLDNRGIIAASTNSGNGGNINLTAADFLLLRRNSSISTTAGLTQSGGDGGNITINTPFIVAIDNEDSDITANAFTGKGGRVNITSQGLFGIEARSQPTPQSDITASSQFGLSGEVIINTPDIDPTQGLVELPTGLTDVSRLVDTSCGAIAGKNGSEFTVTGRGGLPLSPDDFLSSDVVWSDTRLTATVTQQPSKTAIALSSSKPKAVEIVPATGWVFNNQTGEVTLISSASNASGFASPTCAQR
ncbi:MAG: filamentous hemagglutinin N-terminal domain-containing protein [Tolypothrix carrinoi HA7290-LM1]|jgi:filamentous hemagglutinin family protein|nr:filamentous hemagglutinin N-terminal domain-containing protein [Tolypothrix carrinoi HA7290-LM1]